MKKILTSRALLVVLIAFLALLLYAPFFSNAILFDDHGLLNPKQIKELVATPFNFYPRTFPYFTLGEAQILGGVEVNRLINLILHILCGWMLFVLLEVLLDRELKSPAAPLQDDQKFFTSPKSIAFIGAAWFVFNPVAVYGAGYLAQRTILFATLFSLLSLWYYRRAFVENRVGNIVVAALFYSAAVFSKEHAVMVAAATAVVTPLYVENLRAHWKRVALYLLLCAPAALTVVLEARHVIGSTYEPTVSVVLGQIHRIPLIEEPHGPWMVSVVFQTSFFFDYIAYWIVPNIHAMSIDMRVDYDYLWAQWWLIPKAMLFFAVVPFGVYLIRRRGAASLFGCGLLYIWVLYLTELVSVRIQEPFVLYRSYLWAPGYIMMLCSVLCALPRRSVVVASCIPVLAIFLGLADERLSSLQSEYSVWNDAVVKLASPMVPGADRIFYNRGLPYLKQKKYKEAFADFSQAIALRPASHYFYHRGVVHYSLNEFVEAEADFDRALKLNSKDGAIHFARGLSLERRNCLVLANDAYSKSSELGFPLAQPRLMRLAKIRETKEGKHHLDPASCTQETNSKLSLAGVVMPRREGFTQQ